MVRPKGGRGIKAPYETSVIRVPTPTITVIDVIVDEYIETVASGSTSGQEVLEKYSKLLNNNSLTQDEAIEEAKKVLKLKKSARVSLEKLLQIIYSNKEINL